MNRIKYILILFLLSSCTIVSNPYKVSNEMNIFRNIFSNLSKGIISKKDILIFSQKFASTQWWKIPNTKIYSYKKEEIDGLKYEVFENKNSDKSIILLHGGAFYTPLINNYRDMMFYMGEKIEGNPNIYILEYSVYPAQYPKAHDEAYKFYNYLIEDKKIDPNKTVIIGDSAGGHLTVSLIHRLKDENKKLVKALILFSPWLDIENKVYTRELNKYTDVLIGNSMNVSKLDNEVLDPYYFKNADRNSKYILPLNGNFKGFPYVYVQAERTEILLGDTLELIKKISEDNGIDMVDSDIFYGNFHDFQILTTYTVESKKALDKSIEVINKIYKGEK